MNERLTEPERAFAEQRHNLIYSFLNANGLPVNEFYDVVAFGCLSGAQKTASGNWRSRKACRSFSPSLCQPLQKKQRGHIVATLEGYKAQEVMQQQRESVQEYHANNRAIKKAAQKVLPAFLCGGGIAYAWAV